MNSLVPVANEVFTDSINNKVLLLVAIVQVGLRVVAAFFLFMKRASTA